MTTTERHAYRKNIILAVLLVCVGYAFANISDAALKTMAGKFSVFQVIFINSVTSIFFMAVYGWKKEGKKAFRTKKPGWMFIRAALGPLSGACTIQALPHVPLTTFYSLVFTSPFWIILLAAYFLGDKLPLRRLMAVLFGFAVVVSILAPWNGSFNGWALVVLLGALIYSGQMVLVRHIGAHESRAFMGMSGSAFNILAMLPFLFSHYVAPTSYEWGIFAIMGITGTISFLCIVSSFQMAPSAAVVAPYHYTQIFWGALLGYFLFQEVPKTGVMVGSALIILSGIYLVYDETRRSRIIVETQRPL